MRVTGSIRGFRWIAAAAALAVAWGAACAVVPQRRVPPGAAVTLAAGVGLLAWRPDALAAHVERLVAAAEAARGPRPGIEVLQPLDGVLFPRDIAAPDWFWRDPSGDARRWLLRLRLPAREGEIRVLCGRTHWRPDAGLWETIKSHTLEAPAELCLHGIGPEGRVVSDARVRFATSRDPVGAPVFFQRVPLPFARALEQTRQFRWLLADLGSDGPPRTAMQGAPACAFCHHFSADGRAFGMDLDWRGDKGGYLLADLAPRTRLSVRRRISWNDLSVVPGMPNMGLFAKLSPDGRYALATVGEQPFMAVLDQIDYSQLFFPITGRLAWYDRRSGRMRTLPGADDPRFVQTSPAWGPEGRTVFFARAPVDRELQTVMGPRRLLPVAPGTDIHALNRRYRIRFDVYRMAFDGGRGGLAVPLAGASRNGRSNFFPRVSPDGRWVVFTQSPTGLVAQPDSRLMIVPAAGGTARAMRCNRGRFNSWHSWSPNGRWLVFTSKVHSPYTELFLTHVAPDGTDRPPVWLSRLSHPRRAAVIPEFVNRDPGAPLGMVFQQ